jgi:hypothetical protein
MIAVADIFISAAGGRMETGYAYIGTIRYSAMSKKAKIFTNRVCVQKQKHHQDT